MPAAPKNLRDFSSLLKVVEALRGPDGCPWDKEQTHATLTRFAIEEAFELSEAIDTGNPNEICDELGDLLLQVILHAEIARQDHRFDIFDVIENLNRKMVRRHPHVFDPGGDAGSAQPKNSSEVLTRWTKIKAQEKGHAPDRPLSFDIPKDLPALIRSQKIGEKTAKVNFDWGSAKECWPKIQEEIAELEEALNLTDSTSIESEMGDVLFSVAQLARHLNLDSEQALRKTNSRFENRFVTMQSLVREDSKNWNDLTAAERETYWKKAKSINVAK